MTCVKTGCHIYLAEYNQYAYGDAHEYNGVYVFRLVGGPSFDPLATRLHFTVIESKEWFDKYTTDGNSTLISTSVQPHGYEGVPI